MVSIRKTSKEPDGRSAVIKAVGLNQFMDTVFWLEKRDRMPVKVSYSTMVASGCRTRYSL